MAPLVKEFEKYAEDFKTNVYKKEILVEFHVQ